MLTVCLKRTSYSRPSGERLAARFLVLLTNISGSGFPCYRASCCICTPSSPDLRPDVTWLSVKKIRPVNDSRVCSAVRWKFFSNSFANARHWHTSDVHKRLIYPATLGLSPMAFSAVTTELSAFSIWLSPQFFMTPTSYSWLRTAALGQCVKEVKYFGRREVFGVTSYVGSMERMRAAVANGPWLFKLVFFFF